MKNNLSLKKYLPIIFLFFLAFIIRVSKLEEYPSGLTADEAAQGFTAYSILKTSRDEWGVKIPINPRSFGDYKPPLLTYLMIPTTAIFGKGILAIRLPNVILGSLSVMVVYFLVSELLKTEKPLFARKDQEEYFPFFCAFLLAISPWHISLSRGAFEANLSSFFLPAGLLFLLLGLKRPLFFVLSSFFLGLNLFTYHSAKVVTPLVLMIFLIWKRKEIKRVFVNSKVFLIISVFVLLVFSVVMVIGFLHGAGTRASDIGIFSGYKEEVYLKRYYSQILGLPIFLTKIFYNKISLFSNELLRNYFSYFSPTFLFTSGAGEATYGMIPGVGVLYLVEIIFLVFAFYFLLKERQPLMIFMFFWLIISPVAASLTRGVGYHANRAATIMPEIQIISAYGLIKMLEKIKAISLKIKYRLCILTLIIFLLIFLETYFFFGPVINSTKMNYGWKEAMNYLKSISTEEIIISRRFSEPQSFVMLYDNIDPQFVQKQSGLWKDKMKDTLFLDQVGEYALGKYTFRNFSFPEDWRKKGAVLIGNKEDFIIYGEAIERLKRDGVIESEKNINFPDGSLAMKIIKICNPTCNSIK